MKAIFMKEHNNLITAYQKYLSNFPDWQELIKNITPLAVGCGLVYELGNPLESFDASLAIADMRTIKFAEPHYHPHVEIYFILQGTGRVFIGGMEQFVCKGSIVIIPANTAHFTIPGKDLVLAGLNTPPFKPENYIVLTKHNETVKFNHAQFKKLTAQ